MKTTEYNQKVSELIKKLAEKEDSINGILIDNESKIGMNVMNVNNTPSLVICKLDEVGNPIEMIYCISIKDMQSAKRFQQWSNTIAIILHQMQINNTDANTLISGSIPAEEKKSE